MNIDIPNPSDLGHSLLAFARFEIFITPSILIIVYWLGAVGMPLLAVILMRKLRRKLTLPDVSELPAWQRSRTPVIAFGIAMFVFSELMWRMAIETVLAYFQMSDALIGVSSV